MMKFPFTTTDGSWTITEEQTVKAIESILQRPSIMRMDPGIKHLLTCVALAQATDLTEEEGCRLWDGDKSFNDFADTVLEGIEIIVKLDKAHLS